MSNVAFETKVSSWCFCACSGSLQGEFQRKLYKELLANYNRLERPVVNDSAPILVELGLTLLQIIDVVRKALDACSDVSF